jgi:hypothetical protein
MRVLFNVFASAALVGGIMLLPAALVSASTDGTWAQYPSGATVYQAEVQQPINTGNTSNWSAKSKGAIPVMFKLLTGTGPAVFQSIGSDTNTANDYSILQFTPTAGSLTFRQIQTLSTNYTFNFGDCHGGSLRWTLAVIHNGTEQQVHVYYGNPNGDTAAGQSCTGANSGSGKNLISDATLPPNRFEMQGDFGGLGVPVYTTYAATLGVVGDDQVLRASLIIDSGWGGDQVLTISNTTVNEAVHQWDAGGNGTFTATCNLPAATIQVGKSDPVVDGAINEDPVQSSLVDSGNAFRVVDCKYQYILSIPSLSGSGTYYVEIKINGTRVPTPTSTGGSVKFDIK